ncbi:MAG TPA: HAD hydrolase-like protein [Candidatus Limnocylindrales bacterium]|jgi:phosphoglycolate phosphatase-like HAD superfamily hydrolase|nr:HAD hydrolase-like protein [Candidatus Limnocylindrales bacterium]
MDAIVFDWDGTLCDSLPAIYDANRQVLEEYGLPFDDQRYREAYTPDWRVMYQRLGIPAAAIDAAGRRWVELYADAAESGLLPRVQESLERLVAAGFVIGLVTAGARDVVASQLERFEIGHLIASRVYGTDDIAAKPHPDPLLRVLRELDRAEHVATARYVGDVPDDMRMARAVGAVGIGIEGAMAGRDVLIEAGASAVYPLVAGFVDDLLGSEGHADAA